MIILIDNYDSFVYNLARYLTEMGQETRVVRNDQITIDEVLEFQPKAIVISPGPCTPSEAGVSVELISALPADCPVLGVCLGHQAIAQAFGGKIVRAPEPVHGRSSLISHDRTGLFENLPNPMSATRYHSLIVEEASLPGELQITARSPDGLPMALAHRSRLVFGVQFHPESVLTPDGRGLLKNFLILAGLEVPRAALGELIAPLVSREEMPPPFPTDQPIHW